MAVAPTFDDEGTWLVPLFEGPHTHMLMLLPAVNAKRSAVGVLLFKLPSVACVQGAQQPPHLLQKCPSLMAAQAAVSGGLVLALMMCILGTGCVHTCMFIELCKGVVTTKHDACRACNARTPRLYYRPGLHADGWLLYANLRAQLLLLL